jgi:hypothetical protein
MSGARYDDLLAPPGHCSRQVKPSQFADVAREAMYDRPIRSSDAVKVRERRVCAKSIGSRM